MASGAILEAMQGSIRKRGPDLWQVRVSIGRDPMTGRYRYLSRNFSGTKREAQRYAAQLVTEVDHGGHQHPEHHTVAQLLDRWMEHIDTQGRSPTTLVRNRSVIRSNIVPRLGSIRIDRLGPADLDHFYATLAKTGLKPLSIRKAHAVLSAALHQAVKWGWIDRNPADRSSPPPVRGREIIPPTVEEMSQILKALEKSNPDLASFVYVALTTGCRRGELCGLRWGDIDWTKGTLTVSRSIADVPGEVSVKDTKTHATRRLALDPSTLEVFRRQRVRVEARAIAAGVDLAPSAYVWSQELDASTPYRPDRVTGSFIAVRNRLGLDHVTLQACRHFAATSLAGSGIGIRTIAGRLGHANPSVTLKTYAHFLEVADREAATALGGIVAALAAPQPDEA